MDELERLQQENARLRAMARFVDSKLCPSCVHAIAVGSFKFDAEYGRAAAQAGTAPADLRRLAQDAFNAWTRYGEDASDYVVCDRAMNALGEALAVGAPAAPAPEPMDGGLFNLLTQAVEQIEGLRAHVAEKYPDVQRYREGDYELGRHVVGLRHWADHAKHRLAGAAPGRAPAPEEAP